MCAGCVRFAGCVCGLWFKSHNADAHIIPGHGHRLPSGRRVNDGRTSVAASHPSSAPLLYQ